MPRIAILALVAALLTGACSHDDDPGSATGAADPVDAPTSSAPTPVEDPTSSETPIETVPPATGALLKMPSATVRVPDDWRPMDDLIFSMTSASHDNSTSVINLGEIVSGLNEPTASELAKDWRQDNPYPRDPKVLPPVEIDGVEMYHVAGQVDELLWLEEYGAVVDQFRVTLEFQFSSVPRKERDEIIDAVLQTFQWRT